jgi:L-alanine-DL-glutamate epimerase-like enolase superfamily enzyme
MTARRLVVAAAEFALAKPFRIARGVRTSAAVIGVSISQDGVTGRGECTPYARYGETIPSTLETIENCRSLIEAGAGRDMLASHLPAGAARNALDCALWDLEAGRAGRSVADLAGLRPVRDATTAITIVIDTPEAMAAEAAALASAPLLKVKVDAEDPMARIAAVRGAAPAARLIVDPNESWTLEQLADLQPELAAARVDLLEQPIPASASALLSGFARQVPICADEAVHTSADIAQVREGYDFVNIKLDKTGGLTEALQLAQAARAAGLGIMVGCMLCSSLGIAPALLLSQLADFADLDGPISLLRDRSGGFRFVDGRIETVGAGLWGGV